VRRKLGPELKLVVDLLQGVCVIIRQFDFLPPLSREMCSLGLFDVEIKLSGLGVWTHGGVARGSERTGLSVAKTGGIVFVAAEGLIFGRF